MFVSTSLFSKVSQLRTLPPHRDTFPPLPSIAIFVQYTLPTFGLRPTCPKRHWSIVYVLPGTSCVFQSNSLITSSFGQQFRVNAAKRGNLNNVYIPWSPLPSSCGPFMTTVNLHEPSIYTVGNQSEYCLISLASKERGAKLEQIC